MTYVRTSGRNLRQILPFTSTANTTAAGETKYLSVPGAGIPKATEAQAEGYVSAPGTFADLYVELNDVAGDGESYVFTLRKNAADTSLTVTISGASDVTGSDLTHTVHFSKGDTIALKVVASGGVSTPRWFYGGIAFKPD